MEAAAMNHEEHATTYATTPATGTYVRLAAPFELTFKDMRGGIELEYITGEQAISRLNDVLGVDGWSFRILEHGCHQEAGEFWVLGEISAAVGDRTVVRQQFGSQRMKRSRTSDAPLDIGFDLKGATTDALKKCASLLGVGLYLSRKEAPDDARFASGTNPPPSADEPLRCAHCERELQEVRFRDGTSWAPLQLAAFGRRKHGKVLCMDHYREANALKLAEQSDASRPDAAANADSHDQQAAGLQLVAGVR